MANDYENEKPDDSGNDSEFEEYEATREDILNAFWDNEVLFDQVKDHFLALREEVTLATIYEDRTDEGGGIVAMDGSGFYQPLEIDEDFMESLTDLSEGLQPMRLYIQYYLYAFHASYDPLRVEKRQIDIHLQSGLNMKGIIYIAEEEDKTAEEINRIFEFVYVQPLKSCWYYYEQWGEIGGV